jgi:Papain family cysteine protease
MARTRGARSADNSAPLTTRPPAPSRRPPPSAGPGTTPAGKKLDAVPDRIDIRDWFYQPRLAPLPDKIVNCERVPLILDQGQEGACTGFALAAVINFLRFGAYETASVSPRMLYEMARRYDEWPGENYEGSSARGAMIGWVRHGVCLDPTWPINLRGPECFTPPIAEEARRIPGGAFYRVSHREVRDMHAAMAEIGVLYMTLMVHEGWDRPGGKVSKISYTLAGHDRTISLPVIERKDRANGGHAVAIVGYTDEGFIIQNSWGEEWGEGGFALLPYEDYMLHATDVWVAQVGVPIRVDLWQQGYADTTAGVQRARNVIPLADIRPYTVDVGNNGKLSDSGDYWTTPADIERLFEEIIPQRTDNWETKRVLFYLHGGLNDEAAVARRVIAFRDVMLANEIYPVHIMWESGVMEAIRDIIEDLFTAEDERAGGVAEWLRRTRDGLVEAKDWTLELTASAPGTALWSEMKENARLSSTSADGGMQIISETVAAALKALTPAQRRKWELHVVGHSAGSIFAANAIPLFCKSGIAFKTLQFMAPAMTMDLFKSSVMPVAEGGQCPTPDIYILSDTGERDDDVGPYGKSLLYLVSNAFEGRRDTPILGMERHIIADSDVEAFLQSHVVVAGAAGVGSDDNYPLSRSDSHGGFDNDPATMNSLMWRILGKTPSRRFTVRDLQY